MSIVVRKTFLAVFFCICYVLSQAQNCNNWLFTPSNPSYIGLGDLDVPGNQITVEANINSTAINAGGRLYAQDIVSKHTGPTNTNYLLRPNSAEITTSNGYFITPVICNINLNQTYHVAMVYDGATLKFYRDGFLMSQIAATGNLYQNDLNTRVALFDNVTPMSEQFLGYVNEVRIWNVARTQAQIRTYMNTSLPNPTTQTGLMAYYTFNSLLNKQGNTAWNGTLSGAATINATNTNCTFVVDSCSVVTTVPLLPSFTISDTVCVNSPVQITNTTVGASNYYWNFCTADISQAPTGTNMGNVGNLLTSPVYIDYVFDNGNYYGFCTNNFPGKLLRLDFGNSLLNTPTVTDLGTVGGVIHTNTEGIQIIKNNNKWFLVIVGGDLTGGTQPFVCTIQLGTNIANNNPTGTNWGNIGNISYPHDLYVFEDNNIWYGLTVNFGNSSVTRFNLTSDLTNTPTAVNLGNIGNLNGPTGVQAIEDDNGSWHVFITNASNSTLSRLDFGSSLLNTPTGVNFGNLNNAFSTDWDIYIIKYCSSTIGYVINANAGPLLNTIVKLDFNGNLLNTPTAVNFGNIGSLNFQHCISKLFRVGPDVYSFVTNVNNNTLTRFKFPGCTNSSISSSTLQNPPSVSYNIPGNYNINLTIDDGLATQGSYCKQVTVLPYPTINIGPDTTVCKGSPIQLKPTSSNATSFQWTPATYLSNPNIAAPTATPTISTSYILAASNNGFCSVRDTINIIAHNCSTNNNISGVINNYTQVISFLPCENKLIVSDGTAYNANDTVLLIQMKGAIIDTSNTANFGNVLDYKNAGNYEYNFVKQKVGNVIELKNSLTRKYDIPLGKVQLVRVPYFTSATVSTTLTSLPWDGTIGGVLAFNVRDTLYLNADIDVSGKGFRGGRGIHNITNTFNCFQNNFFYPADSYQANEKGESITTLFSDKVYGKGKNANGGGGGNSHNSGGGGGSNASTGGYGGYQYEFSECSVGAVPFDNRGIGGMVLSYNNALNKVFLGGGAGAGQANNPELFYPKGGNGGGITFISTNTLNANNKSIMSNGDSAAICGLGGTGCHEGMGGGGGGGAILLDVQQIIGGIVNCMVSGGKGGNMNVAGNGRLGPGGGGGGGILWTNQSFLPSSIIASLAGGVNGKVTSYGNDPWGTTTGQNGLLLSNLIKPIDIIAFKKPIDSLSFNTTAIDCSNFIFNGLAYPSTTAIVNWQWLFGDGTTANMQNTTHNYNTTGIKTAKLIAATVDGCSDSIILNIQPSFTTADAGNDTLVCHNASIELHGKTINGTSFAWWPAQYLNDSTLLQPIANIIQPTIFYFSVKNSLGCSSTDSVKISVLPKATFIVNPSSSVCGNASVQLLATGGNIYQWSPTQGLSNPSINNPIATPLQTTTYTVSIKETTCNDTAILNTTLNILPNPHITANSANDINCAINQSQLSAIGASEYKWTPVMNLNNPTIYNPIASPTITTIYTVVGKALNGCTDSSSVIVNVSQNGKSGYYIPNAFTPNNDGLNDCFGVKNWGQISSFQFAIYNRYGQKVFYTENPTGCWEGDFNGQKQPGDNYIYYIKATTFCGTIEKNGNVLLIR